MLHWETYSIIWQKQVLIVKMENHWFKENLKISFLELFITE